MTSVEGGELVSHPVFGNWMVAWHNADYPDSLVAGRISQMFSKEGNNAIFDRRGPRCNTITGACERLLSGLKLWRR